MRVITFGDCAVEIGGRSVRPDAEIVFAVLLILAFERGVNVPRERLLGLLWPGLEEARASQRLRQALYKARQLPGIPLVATPSHVQLLENEVDTDFGELVSSQWHDAFVRTAPPAGSFLPDYAPAFSAPYAEWIETQRDLIGSRVRIAMSAAIAEKRKVGAWGEVEVLSRRCLQIDPLDERATLALAEATALGGRKSDALAVLDLYVGELSGDGSDSAAAARRMRRHIAERLSSEPYLRTSEGLFAGRGDSMRLLNECAMRTRGGASTSVFIWGQPGIGKSRLVEEFCRAVSVEGVTACRVGCQASDRERPMAIFGDLVPQMLDLPGALGCSPESLTWLQRFGTTRAEKVELTAVDNAAEEAAAVATAIRRSIFDVLDACADEASLLIVIEDAHWADPVSLDLLSEILEWSGSRRLQFLITSRTPPTLGGLKSGELPSGLVVHRLGALEDEAARALLLSMLSSRGINANEGFVGWAVRVAEGNPLYLRELLGKWLETGSLTSVPPTLETLLSARIGALGASDLRVLQGCAVLRRHGRTDRVQHLVGYGNAQLLEALEVLGKAGLIVVDGERVECRHELIVDYALEHASDVTRQALYRFGAELLDAEARGTGGMSLLWDSARLWHQAGDTDRAIASGIELGERLLSMGAPKDAATVLDQTCELCASDDQRLRVLESSCHALQACGQYQRMSQVLQLKRSIREANQDYIAEHDADELSLLEASWKANPDPRVTLPAVLSCVHSPEASENHRIGSAVLGLVVSDAMCDLDTAEAIFAAVEPLIQRGLGRRRDQLYVSLVFHTSFGSLTDAEAFAKELVDECRRERVNTSLCRALRNVSNTYRRTGRFDIAISCLTEALHIAKQSQIASGVIPCIEGLVQCYIGLGDLRSARQWHSIGTQHMGSEEDAGTRISMMYLDAEIALWENSRPPSRILGDASLRRLRKNPALRIATYSLALAIGASAAHGRKPSADDVAQLLRLHLQTRARGGHDFTSLCLSLGLRAADRTDEARSLMGEYLATYRRELSVPPNALWESVP
jgi:DNA-binding SARP family transcriptional activator